MITEPRWKSFIVETTKPIFTPEQCKLIIQAGRVEPKQDAQVGSGKGIKGGVIDTKTRTSHISWIPFKKMIDMYKDIEQIMKTTNGNHFGFDRICNLQNLHNIPNILKVDFYDWHVDNDVNMCTRTAS
jgi:hypothetical protein